MTVDRMTRMNRVELFLNVEGDIFAGDILVIPNGGGGFGTEGFYFFAFMSVKEKAWRINSREVLTRWSAITSFCVAFCCRPHTNANLKLSRSGENSDTPAHSRENSVYATIIVPVPLSVNTSLSRALRVVPLRM